MPHAFGYRSRTRHLFARGFRRHGLPNLSTYMVTYKKNDFVDIIGNGAIHKGMPHKYYHGRTGRVFNVNPTSIGVIINKQVRTRIIQKRIHVRVEHVKRSTCQENFKKMVKAREAQKRSNKNVKVGVKRQPIGPRAGGRVEKGDTTVLFQNPEFHKEIF
jgi:large subunit ribosomal protein L21e